MNQRRSAKESQSKVRNSAKRILAGVRRSGHRVVGEESSHIQGPDNLPVRASKRVGMPYVLFVCVVIFLAAACYIFHLHVRFEGVQMGYEASQQRKIQTQLLLERRELRLELASLKEQKRIEQEARKKLGMETPTFNRIIPVTKKRRVVSVSGGAL